jgi:uncharacterized protein (TIGR02147 family)
MKKYSTSQILKLAFSRLKKQNPAISIRGMALKLNISHAFLSKVIAGKAAVPEARLKDIIKIFQLDPFATKELKDAMIANLAATEKIEKLLQREKTKKKRAIEVFEERPAKHLTVLANWYELPILEYLTCEGVNKDTDSIADSLSIKASAVIQALKKMEEANLVAKDENGEWKKISTYLRFPAHTPSAVLRNYYTDVLKRATEELGKTSQEDYDRRLLINFSIATSADKISDIKERLSQYLYDLSIEMAEGSSDQVYHLTLGLIPITKSRKTAV